jgi:hypothetical protein
LTAKREERLGDGAAGATTDGAADGEGGEADGDAEVTGGADFAQPDKAMRTTAAIAAIRRNTASR